MSSELCVWLSAEHDTFISSPALSRMFRSEGLTSEIIQKRTAERDNRARAEFHAMHRENFIGDGSEFAVVDQTSKNERTFFCSNGSAFRGSPAQLRVVFVWGAVATLICTHDLKTLRGSNPTQGPDQVYLRCWEGLAGGLDCEPEEMGEEE